ncbi:MAG: Gfo/Idh/MocA family oxidoreductase [Candidatus Hydrogenedentes bacterium]|nr:Gfo/Idh/MocA family oxidoreductase [Candidatus Hydrogenedentota bacterium]
MIRAGLMGYGYWGPNLARNLNAHKEMQLVRIAEMKDNRARLAQQHFPGASVVSDPREVTTAADIDLVVIATPVFTHYELAKTALENGKHVWVEKPMTSTSAQAKELVDLAASKNLVLMVDHTFLFTGAVKTIKELIDTGELGDLYYYDSVRINLGLFQHDVNVIWDLAPHDFSIMDYLLGPSAQAVSAHAVGHFDTGLEDVAYVSVFYPNNLIAHFHVNWLSPVKLRRAVLGGSKKMLVWDDLNPEERIKVYDKGMEVQTQEGLYRVLATPRIGAMHAPIVPGIEALSTETDYLVECINSGQAPFNDGQAGLRIVSILEATGESLKGKGKFIEL